MARIGDRGADEIRPVRIEIGYVDYPEGSVLIHMGNTRVLCNASLDTNVPAWMKGRDKPGGWITAEYAMLPRSTHSRRNRETLRPQGRTQEISRLIGRSLRAAFDLEQLDGYTCTVDCDVLQADGGTRTAAVTGGYVAASIAIRKLVEEGVVSQDVFKAPVAAVSVGIVNGEMQLDLCYEEDVDAAVDLNVVMDGDMNYIEVQGTGEKGVFSKGDLMGLLTLAEKGIKELLSLEY